MQRAVRSRAALCVFGIFFLNLLIARLSIMKIRLGLGKTQIDFEYDPDQFEILGTEDSSFPLSDRQIGEKLDQPCDSKPLEEIVKPNETVLIVVPDATRNVGCGQIVNLLVRRLIANGTLPYEINIIFATGIHRGVTAEEKEEILTPFIAQRIKTFDHDSRDLMQLVRLGELEDGSPIELNRKLTEYDHVITIGGINFHYFAGFTGGRKLICPGLASSRTIAATHKLAFNCKTKDRRDGVAAGRLAGNPVHEAFTSVARISPPSFSINTLVNEAGAIVDLFCGNWESSHEKACAAFSKSHSVEVDEKRDVVIVSCGGFPNDLNMIQAHKALEMASKACKDNGTIVFLAECADGLGRDDFLKWFDEKDSRELADRLCERYQVNGQTAWSLLKKAERFKLKLISELPSNVIEKLRMEKIDNMKSDLSELFSKRGFIVPFGAKFNIEKDG